MIEPADLIRSSRLESGLTQAELATRMGTSQAVIARLERHGSNPTVATLDRALRAAGRTLSLSAVAAPVLPAVDEQQIRAHLRMTPAERLRSHQVAYENHALAMRNRRRLP